MSTRAERKRRANRARCRNCGQFARHFDPWTKRFVCVEWPDRMLYPGEFNRQGQVGP